MNSIRYLIPVGLTVILLAGCSIFGDKDEELPPAELQKFKQTLDLKKVWSAKVGGGSELLRLALAPAGDGSRVYTASYDGVISAFNPDNGKRLWRNELKISLSAGPGVGENMVVVTGENGEVIAFGAADGSELWRTDVSGEALAIPLVTDEGVVIYTIDGRLRVLSLLDGTERWSMEQDLPALTLRGLSSPIIVGNTIIVGFDNGKLMALELDAGNT